MNNESHRMRRDQKIKLIVGIAVLILAIAALWFGLKWLDSRNTPEGEQFGDHGDWGKTAEEEQKLLVLDGKGYVYTDDIKTYLLIGTDVTGTEKPESGRGEMADFLMLFVVNKTTNSYGFIHINRDIMMDVPILDENGKENGTYPEQICISHWYGRTPEERNANTVKAVSKLLGFTDIDGYYCINMKDVGALNDAIGGVQIKFDEDLTAVDPAFKEGADILLNADQAEAYVRARMTVGDGTNEERMARQLNYMHAAYNRVINQLREEPNYINTLYDEMEDSIQTDQDHGNLGEFANYISKGESKGFLKFEGKSELGDTQGNGVEHAEFYLTEGTIARTLSQLIYLKDEE